MRLIDADELKKAITEATYNFEQIPIRVDKVQEIIDNAPTIEEKAQRERNLDKEIELYKSKVAFYESQNTCGEYDTTARELKYVVETLEALCSERPQGKWIIEHDWVHCSSCGHEQNYPSNFCPNCGADMRKEA